MKPIGENTIQASEQQMRLPYARLRPKGETTWCYCETREVDSILDGDAAEGYEIEFVHLTFAEWHSLPEFVGW